jgi:regulator of sigma D
VETNNITTEQYIEHEVKIRVMKEVNDERFLKIDEQIKKIEEKIDSRFLLLIGLIITSIVLPVVLHSLKLV